MFPIPTHSNTEIENCQEVIYEQQMASRIAAQHVAEAKERSIPLWMLTGFPAVSDEPDQDDDIAFEEG